VPEPKPGHRPGDPAGALRACTEPRETGRLATFQIVPGKYIADRKPEVNSMAKPIEIGLVLEGDDARRFHKYMEDPKITKEGRKLIREAIKIAKKEKLYA
jgi:hypothetical protein